MLSANPCAANCPGGVGKPKRIAPRLLFCERHCQRARERIACRSRVDDIDFECLGTNCPGAVLAQDGATRAKFENDSPACSTNSSTFVFVGRKYIYPAQARRQPFPRHRRGIQNRRNAKPFTKCHGVLDGFQWNLQLQQDRRSAADDEFGSIDIGGRDVRIGSGRNYY